MSSFYSVIVIGGGLSGLSTAKWLLDSGINDVLVLESRDRVGGRTYTKCNDSVKWVDLGGSYVGPTQDHILRMAKDMGVNTYKVNLSQDSIHYRDGVRTCFKSTEGPYFGFRQHLDQLNFFRLLDKMGEEIPEEAPWSCPHASDWDQMTFKEFIEQNCATNEIEQLGKLLIKAYLGAGVHEVSLLSVLWYIKQCKGTKRFFSGSNGGQERKFEGGSQQISERLAEYCGHSRVLTNKPVTLIKQCDGYVEVKTLDGSTYCSHYLVIAMSPAMMAKFHFEPPLPPAKNHLIQKFPMGCVIKTVVYYERPFWREMGYSGNLLIEDDDQDFPIETFDDTKSDGTVAAIVGFVLADKTRMVDLSPEQRRDKICRCYAKVFGTTEALKSVHYEEINWMSEAYSGGCYTGICPPGLLTMYGPVLRESVGRMFFAGTETATQWSGYMNGAVEAGERAAREVLHAMGKISADEINRVEPENQEVRALPFEVSFWEEHLPSTRLLEKVSKIVGLVGFAATAAFVYRKQCVHLITGIINDLNY